MSIRLSQHYLSKLVIILTTAVSVATTVYGQAPVTTVAANASGSQPTVAPTTGSPSGSTIDVNYVIGPSDVLAIDVWHEKELSRDLPVRPDGKISLPLLGELNASGKTPMQLQETISEHLKEYLEHPQVTVIVQEPKSHSFNVVGEVQKPGAFVFGHPLTVLDAIALAGGFRDFAKSNKMYVLRTMEDGSQHRLTVNYNDVIKGKKPSENIFLQSHDTVVVP